MDGNGNAVLLGITNGVVTWGNNVETNCGTIQDRAVTLLQIDSTGTPQWELHGGSDDYDVPQGLSVLPDGICDIAVQVRDTFLMGGVAGDLSTPHLLLARIAPGIITGVEEVSKDGAAIIAYPSPFTSVFSISAEPFSNGAVDVLLRDGIGRVVSQGHRMDGLGSTLAAGSYLVEVRQGESRWCGRVVKQ